MLSDNKYGKDWNVCKCNKYWQFRMFGVLLIGKLRWLHM